jgi:carbon monoxide dehydrogenase subunit G
MITLKHSFDVEADVSTTWEFLQDLTKVAACMPGAHLAAAEGGEYVGGLSARIGPISAKYNGTATFLEVDEVGHRAVIEAKGREAKGSGSASATITPVLSATTSGTTVDVRRAPAEGHRLGRGRTGCVSPGAGDRRRGRSGECRRAQVVRGDAVPGAR